MLNLFIKMNFATFVQIAFYTGLSIGGVVAFIAAMPAGAACGALMAPKSGKRSRKQIASDALLLLDGMIVTGNTLVHKGRKIITVLNS